MTGSQQRGLLNRTADDDRRLAAGTMPPTGFDAADCATHHDPSRTLGSDVAAGLPVGRLLGERYLLQQPIGIGAYSLVYRATEQRHQRPCAVKVRAPGAPTGSDARADLRSEVRVHRGLFHPHIVGYHDSGIEPDGTLYSVMEHLAGPSLQAYVERRGRLPLAEALAVISQIGAALQYLHDKGLLHGDVCPSNIVFVSEPGEALPTVKLIDFGLAQERGSLRAFGDHAQKWNLLPGTPSFLSPEATHMPSDMLDERSDQWSLNIVLWWLLSGTLPFAHANSLSLCHLICTATPSDLATQVPGLPQAVYATIERALSKNRQDRFACITDYLRSLQGLPLLESQTALPEARDGGHTTAAVADHSGPVTGAGVGPNPRAVPSARRPLREPSKQTRRLTFLEELAQSEVITSARPPDYRASWDSDDDLWPLDTDDLPALFEATTPPAGPLAAPVTVRYSEAQLRRLGLASAPQGEAIPDAQDGLAATDRHELGPGWQPKTDVAESARTPPQAAPPGQSPTAPARPGLESAAPRQPAAAPPDQTTPPAAARPPGSTASPPALSTASAAEVSEPSEARREALFSGQLLRAQRQVPALTLILGVLVTLALAALAYHVVTPSLRIAPRRPDPHARPATGSAASLAASLGPKPAPAPPASVRSR